MTVRLQAPLPAPQTTLLLPNPQTADVSSRRHELDMFRAIDGTKRTSVKSNERQTLTYTFVMDRIKAEGLKAFLRAYNAQKIRLQNHKSEVWEVYVGSNPIEFGQDKRNRMTCQLQLEGVKVS